MTSPAQNSELFTPSGAVPSPLSQPEPSSAVSTMGQTTPIAHREPGTKPRSALLPVGVAAVMGIGIAVFAASVMGPAAATAPSTTAPSALTDTVQAARVGDASPKAERTGAPSAPEATAAPHATATPEAAASAQAPEKTPAAEKTPAPPSGAKNAAGPPTPTPAAKKADCTNPFIVDATGKKRPRPECF